MAAALAAASSGASVTLLEKASTIGGTTAISGGGIWVPANPWSAAAGVSDDVDNGLRYLAGLRLGDVDPVLAEAYVRRGTDIAHVARGSCRASLAAPRRDERLPLRGARRFPRWSLDRDRADRRQRGGRQRVRLDPYATLPWTINEEAATVEQPPAEELERRERDGILTRGRGLIAAMFDALVPFAVDIRTGVGAVSLTTSGRAVTGVDIRGEELRGAVVVATGGFERDEGLVAAFLRGPVLAPAGPPSNTGDGLRLGMSVGAALGNMSEAWWCPAINVPGEQSTERRSIG